jgi:hypothetical protein
MAQRNRGCSDPGKGLFKHIYNHDTAALGDAH